MKIFVLLSRIPWPLEKGDKLRAFNQLKELSKQHEIVLCALNSDRKTDKQAAFRALQPIVSRSILWICQQSDFYKPGISLAEWTTLANRLFL